MAVTGLLLVVFLVGHLAGNLLVYKGAHAVNDYAAWLKGNTLLLWGVRVGLLLILLVHLGLGVVLHRENRAARPVAYVKDTTVRATFASRTMLLTGLMILAFVVYHLLHFTIGVVQPGNFASEDPSGRHDVFAMVVKGFHNPLVVISYLVAMALLWIHLVHAISSIFQSLGLKHPNFDRGIGLLGPGVATILVLGFISIPLSIWLGVVSLPGGPQ